jgi:aminocarboxymuconate-semialdehyde decarboxylase
LPRWIRQGRVIDNWNAAEVALFSNGLDSTAFAADLARRPGTPVFVHARPVASDQLPRAAAATFGVGIEGVLAAAAVITGGVVEKYPELGLAFSRGAGGFPLMLPHAQWFWGRTWNEEPSGSATGVSPAELARRFYYDSLVFDHRAIR